jgi:hypothetical protein
MPVQMVRNGIARSSSAPAVHEGHELVACRRISAGFGRLAALLGRITSAAATRCRDRRASSLVPVAPRSPTRAEDSNLQFPRCPRAENQLDSLRITLGLSHVATLLRVGVEPRQCRERSSEVFPCRRQKSLGQLARTSERIESSAVPRRSINGRSQNKLRAQIDLVHSRTTRPPRCRAPYVSPLARRLRECGGASVLRPWPRPALDGTGEDLRGAENAVQHLRLRKPDGNGVLRRVCSRPSHGVQPVPRDRARRIGRHVRRGA